jgi:tetratricopeptide (TPR) repeat protein
MGIFGIRTAPRGRRHAWAWAAAALATASAPFAPAFAGDIGPAPVSARTRANLENLRQMAAAGAANDCKEALKIGLPMIDSRHDLELSGEGEAFIYGVVITCEAASDKERAYAHALRATALKHATDDLWRFRLALELETHRNRAAVVTVEAMARARQAALNLVPVDWMGFLNRALKEAKQEDLQRRLLKVLASDSYVPDEAFGLTDDFRYPYAAMLAEKGETEAARTLVAALRSPDSMVEASLDSRLRRLVPAELDVRRAAEAVLALHEEAIARHPDRLSPLIEAARDLRLLGRPREAVELLETAAAQNPDAASDRDEKLNWWWDSVASSEAALGRYDDAVVSLRKGAALKERGGANVSQVINLADLQINFGHGEEALKTLGLFDDPTRKGSPYGEMELRLARGCAHVVAGHPADAAADLAFARTHEKDDPRALSDLLLCVGDMDGAAAAFIRRLDDPDRRGRALLQLSDYDEVPVPVPAGPVNSRLGALKQRPDVKAAIERAGGIRRIPLQQGEL